MTEKTTTAETTKPTEKTTATEKTPKTDTPPTVLTEEMEAKKTQILQMKSKRHVKIWLLHEIVLLKNKEIAVAMGTNQGHVGNVVRDYNAFPEKIATANELLKGKE